MKSQRVVMMYIIVIIPGLNPLKRDRYGFTKSGYDVYYCNYSWEGPFALLQSLRVWEILYQQSPDFLMGIPRICYTLELLPLAWKRQFWVEQGRDVTGKELDRCR